MKVSHEFLRRLGTLPRKSEYIFKNLNRMETNFWSARKRLARKLNNSRVEAIRFITFRHWKGTIEYHRTHDILHVKALLGHKAIQSTMLYVHLEALVFDEITDDFHVAVARSFEEDKELVEAGFEYVTDRDDLKIYRKRK